MRKVLKSSGMTASLFHLPQDNAGFQKLARDANGHETTCEVQVYTMCPITIVPVKFSLVWPKLTAVGLPERSSSGYPQVVVIVPLAKWTGPGWWLN